MDLRPIIACPEDGFMDHRLFSVERYGAIIAIGEFESNEQETVTAYFKVLSHHSIGGIEESE
jgi:hypothetical protein